MAANLPARLGTEALNATKEPQVRMAYVSAGGTN